MFKLAKALAFLLIFILPSSTFAADTSPSPPTPYQILGKTQIAPFSYVAEDGLYLEDRMIMIDFGGVEGKTPPKTADIPQEMVIIGSKGTALATFNSFKKECDYLCSTDDAGETCHYTGLYSFTNEEADIGAPLFALPGKMDIRDFKNIWDARIVKDALFELPGKLPSKPTVLIQSPYDGENVKLQINSISNAEQQMEITITTPGIFSKGEKIKAGECIGHQYGTELSSISCDSLALLLADKKPLILSSADYNDSIVRVLSSFKIGEQEYVAVRIGLKSHSPIGLLFKGKDGWKLLLRPRNYASLC